MKKKYKIIFLNQTIGPLYNELALDVSRKWSPSAIITGVKSFTTIETSDSLEYIKAPVYNTKNYFTRILSWLLYWFVVLFKLLFVSSNSILFIVSNPPFLGLLGHFFNKIRGQRYIILVYDNHPDVLVNFGILKRNGIVAKLWQGMNRMVMNRAEVVITIGEYMADNIAKKFDVNNTKYGKIAVVHNWADTDWIIPLDKENNSFVKEYSLNNKFVIMYSGNLGATHDLETVMAAAKELKTDTGITFIIIGEGAKKQYVVDIKDKHQLDNVLILPFFPQEQLPRTLSAADCALVTMSEGSEGNMVPSKLYYSLSAGNAIIALCKKECELTNVVTENKCGLIVRPGEVDKLVQEIKTMKADPDYIGEMKRNSRNTAVEKFSRKSTDKYIEILKEVFC